MLRQIYRKISRDIWREIGRGLTLEKDLDEIIENILASGNLVIATDPEVLGGHISNEREPQQGQSIYFDGVDDVAVASSTGVVSNSSPWGIELVMKLNASVNWKVFYSETRTTQYEPAFFIRTGDSNKLGFKLRGDDFSVILDEYSTIPRPTVGQWFTLKIAYDGINNIVFSVDENSYEFAVGAFELTTDTISFGAWRRGGGITSSDFSEVSFAYAKLTSNGVVVNEFKFCETSGLTALDSSPNKNHATLEGGVSRVTANNIPLECSWLNNGGWNTYVNRIAASNFIGSVWGSQSWAVANRVVLSDGWTQLTKSGDVGSSYLNQYILLKEGVHTYEIEFSTKANSVGDVVRFGCLRGSTWQSPNAQIISGAGTLTQNTLSTVDGLDENETRIRYEAVIDSDEPFRVYVYPVGLDEHLTGTVAYLKDMTIRIKDEELTNRTLITGDTAVDSFKITESANDSTIDSLGAPIPTERQGKVFPVPPKKKNSFAGVFDGVDDKAYLSDPIDFNVGDSFEFLIKSDKVVGQHVFSTSNQGRRILLNPTEVIVWEGGQSTWTHNVDISEWHVYKLTKIDEHNLELFVDGNSMGVSTHGDVVIADLFDRIADKAVASGVELFGGQIAYIKINDELIPFSTGVGNTLYSTNGGVATISGASTNTKGQGFWGGRQNIYHHNLDYGFSKYPFVYTATARIRFNTTDITPFNLTRVKLGVFFTEDVTAQDAQGAIISLSSTNGAASLRTGNSTSLVTGESLCFNGNPNSRHYLNTTVAKGYHEIDIVWDGVSRYLMSIDGDDNTLHHSNCPIQICNQVWLGPSLDGSNGRKVLITECKLWDDNDDLKFDLDPVTGKDLVTGTPPTTINTLLPSIPASLSNTKVDALTNSLQLQNSPRDGHNLAETELDFKYISEEGTTVPCTNTIDEKYATVTGDTVLENPVFVRQVGEELICGFDRYLSYCGTDPIVDTELLSDITTYTTTTTCELHPNYWNDDVRWDDQEFWFD